MVMKILRKYRLPLYILTHPFDGFYAMKYQNEGTLKLAFFNLFLLILANMINLQYTSLIVTQQNPLTLNSINNVSIMLAMLALFCISNWSVTSLTDGEGRLKDIFMSICYAMTPLIFTVLLATLVSRGISVEEVGFYNMILTVGVVYFVFLVFCGLVVVHNYGAVKSVVTIFLTFVAMATIVFLIALLFTLWQ